jgi:hypothetical protein
MFKSTFHIIFGKRADNEVSPVHTPEPSSDLKHSSTSSHKVHGTPSSSARARVNARRSSEGTNDFDALDSQQQTRSNSSHQNYNKVSIDEKDPPAAHLARKMTSSPIVHRVATDEWSD